jgi:hypothetical protein
MHSDALMLLRLVVLLMVLMLVLFGLRRQRLCRRQGLP